MKLESIVTTPKQKGNEAQINKYRMRILCFIFLFCSSIIYGRESAQITGTIKNSVYKRIYLEIDNQYIDNTQKKLTADLDGDAFKFDIDLPEPRMITIKYLRQAVQIYLEPGDQLHIDSDANSFLYSFQFSGKGAANNEMLAAFRKQFPEEISDFKMMKYKKGIFWYKAEKRLDKMMRNTKPEAFRVAMDKIKLAKQTMVDNYESTHQVKLSESFKDYMWSEVHYDWAYNLLVYGFAFGNWHQINQTAYFEYLGNLLMQNDLALNNPKYRNFLVGVINYKCTVEQQSANPYANQIQFASKHLNDRSQAYVVSTILNAGLREKKYTPVVDYYHEFIASNPHKEFNKGVEVAYDLATRYAPGSDALAFSLKDTLGQTVTLESLKGKVVYLNFWASWCRPCVQKMWELQLLADNFADRNIEFVHITFDKEVSVWRNEIAKNQFTGTHLIAPEGVKSDVAVQYNIKTLPGFYIIDENGRFVRKPGKFNIDAINKTLMQLTSPEASQPFGTSNKNKNKD